MNPEKIRNLAIIAHVDHGKTTLVDSMLHYTQTVSPKQETAGLIMDSMDLERERGMTIQAKNASLNYKGYKFNLVDTPGHADFGGEVERTLRMVDGALLLIDAKEGPMPQTKFVLRKSIELGHRIIVVVNKIDRPDARIEEVVNRTFDLFVSLDASSEQLDFPIVYTCAVDGIATMDMEKEPAKDLAPLMDTIVESLPAPEIKDDGPLQILVLALAYDTYKGKMGIGKITAGKIRKSQPLARIDAAGKTENASALAIMSYQGLERVELEEASAGDIVAVAGFKEMGIGNTICAQENPVALNPVQIEQPTLRMTFSVNKSPFAGREGKYVTSRVLRDRLFKELETNVALRVNETDSPEAFVVSGRGELHLAVLIETMRREGYEMEVSQPEVVYRTENGQRLEPIEWLSIDVPEEYQGVVIEEVGKRRGDLKEMGQSSSGDYHFEYHMTTRGLLGLKRLLLRKTRGTVIMHHVFESYAPFLTDLPEAEGHGSLVATDDGTTTAYALFAAEDRGELFVGPGVEVYKGMVIGQANRDMDVDINICKQKKLTNMRSSTADATVVLTPPRPLSLELAIEYLGPDELLEVTPDSLRIRKKIADPKLRIRAQREKNR